MIIELVLIYIGQHKIDRYKKKFSAKRLLAVLMCTQITEKDSLRDIETYLSVLKNNLYKSLTRYIMINDIIF